MKAGYKKKLLFALVIAAATLPGLFCNTPEKVVTENPVSPWRNVYDTAAQYVGMQTCRGCHEEVYQTFIQTGMGQSFNYATKTKSAADFAPAHALVYDSALDYYYKPFWDKDSLCILEYRLSGTDTVHKRLQRVTYIIGSGQHTNSHIFNINGYLYQAPITFYTQKHQWDLAPGFEKGASSRFQRLIQLECMSCHNGLPDFVAGSENRFSVVKTGIDCERCHGPGSLHVMDKQSGKIVDTSKGPDYSIVNPRRLPTELQNNVCQRCHLQGITVLNDGKNFYDFRPGMHLSEVMNVFMPQYEGAKDKMIMASHVERMKKSPCYVQSGKMSCINCHNPHISVKFTPRTQYLNACQSCHPSGTRKYCSETEQKRMLKQNDCITCHMPHNGSIDIPHVAVTDHYIRKRPQADTIDKKITSFLGMRCFNNDKPDAITVARSFMEFYERYTPSDNLLDSALVYLGRDAQTEERQKQNKDLIRVYFLKHNFLKVTELAAALKPEAINDAWTAYRIGESFYNTDQLQNSEPWYKKATVLWPYSLDFQNKLGICLLAQGKTDAALPVFKYVTEQNPGHVSANTNLGFIYMQLGNNSMAYSCLLQAKLMDPDYEQNLINLAVWYHNNKKYDEAEKCLRHLLAKHPENEKARMMLTDLVAGRD
jgi:Tfp pilus assembly protein PilF